MPSVVVGGLWGLLATCGLPCLSVCAHCMHQQEAWGHACALPVQRVLVLCELPCLSECTHTMHQQVEGVAFMLSLCNDRMAAGLWMRVGRFQCRLLGHEQA